jgi:hypothetical protein
VLSATPVDREHDVAHIIIDIDNDVGDQRPKQLLACPHRHVRGCPSRRQIVREVGEGPRIDSDIG